MRAARKKVISLNATRVTHATAAFRTSRLLSAVAYSGRCRGGFCCPCCHGADTGHEEFDVPKTIERLQANAGHT